MPTFERRRCRAEQDRQVFKPGTHYGHVAAMIARRRLLLVRALMLLIDHDQAELARRSKYGTASAHDHVSMPGGDAPPMAAALGIAQVAVQHRHLAAAAIKALDGLRRQADFGHKHKRFLALPHYFLDRPQVDFGLSAARDAMQQERVKATLL